MKLRGIITISFAIVFILAGMAGSAGAITSLRVATVIPDNTDAGKGLREMFNRIKQESGDEVDFKVYAGGIAGDELDVIRRMRVNRIDIGVFTGVGMGRIMSHIRVLEAPGLFRTFEEEDLVKARMHDEFAADFEERGFVLLGLGGGGFVYLFSRHNLLEVGLDKLKMWTWKGDPVAQMFMESMGMGTIPLHIADVNMGLETGMIDSFYVVPAGATALQWYTRTQYMLEYPVSVVSGGFLMNKKAFYSLSEKTQELFRRVLLEETPVGNAVVRKLNEDSIGILKEYGIKFLKPSPEKTAELDRLSATAIQTAIAKGIFSQELYDRIQNILAEHRGKQ